MNDLRLILNELFKCMTMEFIVFGYKLSLFSVFIGLTLLSIVIYGVVRLFD